MEKKTTIYSLEASKKETIDRPKVFDIKPRKDLIQKANQSSQSRKKQAQGRDPKAGLRNTAVSWGSGHELSRAPRLKGSGYPTARNVGRVPFAKGGRAGHPIKVDKKLEKRINKKTKKFALISAISASGDRIWVENRGHIIEKIPEIPLVVDDKIQTIKKTDKIYSILSEFGLEQELSKIKESKKIRAGKGKRRGRKYKHRKGFLIVIKDDFGIVKASRNISGADIVKIDNLSIDNLAPGGHPGRLVLWTQSAFNELNKYEGLLK